MSYHLREHRHRFAIWAAARASQRGFTTVGTLRDALQATDIQKVLSDPETLRISEDEFNELHQRWCRLIRSRLRRRVAEATYGRAAKLVAIYPKATVIMGENCDSPLGRHLHPPIDRRLLKGLASSDRIASPHKSEWRSINWTGLTKVAYFRLIRQLRNAIPDDAPFWAIEEYWQPSEPMSVSGRRGQRLRGARQESDD